MMIINKVPLWFAKTHQVLKPKVISHQAVAVCNAEQHQTPSKQLSKVLSAWGGARVGARVGVSTAVSRGWLRPFVWTLHALPVLHGFAPASPPTVTCMLG